MHRSLQWLSRLVSEVPCLSEKRGQTAALRNGGERGRVLPGSCSDEQHLVAHPVVYARRINVSLKIAEEFTTTGFLLDREMIDPILPVV